MSIPLLQIIDIDMVSEHNIDHVDVVTPSSSTVTTTTRIIIAPKKRRATTTVRKMIGVRSSSSGGSSSDPKQCHSYDYNYNNYSDSSCSSHHNQHHIIISPTAAPAPLTFLCTNHLSNRRHRNIHCPHSQRMYRSSHRHTRPTMILFILGTLLISLSFSSSSSHAFVVLQSPVKLPHHHPPQSHDDFLTPRKTTAPHRRHTAIRTTTALPVWWYGGNDSVVDNNNNNNDSNTNPAADSCELVAVRIERTSPNSRRITGDITVAAPLSQVWAILTDYNRLSTHVPNLVESRVERPLTMGTNGDGQYQCRLYQKGAQKIIGFEFGASVTMDMKEMITRPRQPLAVPKRPSTRNSNQNRLPPEATTLNWSSSSSSFSTTSTNVVEPILREERKITFKCVDSFFFREFDGEWKVQEFQSDNDDSIETIVSYVVDVRPKGPVPVAALEWRIREDVPTNLRAVKKAALLRRSLDEYTSITNRSSEPILTATLSSSTTPSNPSNAWRRNNNNSNAPPPRLATSLARDARTKVQWLQDETMAAYLTNNNNNNNN